MPYSKEVVHRAFLRLREAEEQHASEYREYLRTAYQVCPRLKEIDSELSTTLAQIAAAAFNSGDSCADMISHLEKNNLRLQDERKWLIDANELSEEMLEYTPVCTKCGSRGYNGAVMCECLRELCRQEQKRELVSLFQTGHESFDNFSLAYYSDRISEDVGASPREMMRRNLAFCRKYAAEFRRGAESLLFSGPTGLGKTYLSACIARVVSEAGFSVTYESACRVFSDFDAVKFDRETDESLTDRYLQCDLLILDDLGTELTTPNVISSFYLLVNTRITKGLPTIVSTNLAPTELPGRYSAQTGSRLNGVYELVPFIGDDIRPMLRNR